MDLSDKNFKPCPCGYQICQFCYNNIRQNPELNGKCPGCRRLYDDASVEYKNISAEDYKLQQLSKDKKERERKQREKEKKDLGLSNKKHLYGLRVVKKNLVYVTGLNPPCSSDELQSVLKSEKYFGQFGSILKIVINKRNINNVAFSNNNLWHNSNLNQGLVVYVTFGKNEDALKCINSLDGSVYDGKTLRASHGTTKYCSSYLKGVSCLNSNCMFLHEPGEDADLYLKKDIPLPQDVKIGSQTNFNLKPTMKNNCNLNTNNFNTNVRSGLSVQNNYNNDDIFNHSSDLNHCSQNNDQININTINSSSDNLNQILSTHFYSENQNNQNKENNSNLNGFISNPASFPTLGETFCSQKKQKKEFKTKNKGSKETYQVFNEYNYKEDLSKKLFRETILDLNFNLKKNQKHKVSFKSSFFTSVGTKSLPLFSFNKLSKYPNETDFREEKIIARNVIEKFILKPFKNHHIPYHKYFSENQQSVL